MAKLSVQEGIIMASIVKIVDEGSESVHIIFDSNGFLSSFLASCQVIEQL